MILRITLLLFSFNIFASELLVRSLKDMESVDFLKLISPKTVLVVFQANCPSCRAQINDLNCLKDDYNVVLLGAFSREKELRKNYLKYHANYPGYMATKEVLNYLKITRNITPQTFVFKDKKIKMISGRVECSKVKL